MMAGARYRRHRSNQPVVLVFGESLNDARAVKSLIEALCPSLQNRVKEQARPPSLQRAAGQQPITRWMLGLRQVVEVVSRRTRVSCVFVQRDSDGPDPQGRLAASTEPSMSQVGIDNGYAVVPVEEIESWWLMFPEATESLRTSWAGTLPTSRRTVDVISNPKEELVRRTARKDRRKAYAEADSPDVARLVGSAIALGQPPRGASPSFERFKRAVAECCTAQETEAQPRK